MTRSLIIFLLTAVVISTLIMPFVVLHPGDSVVGGEYHISSNTLLEEDMSFYFAQVTVDEDVLVDGQIFLYSSTLNLRGHVTKDIHAFESDLTLHDTARVDGEVDESDFIHWTLLLPGIVQFP